MIQSLKVMKMLMDLFVKIMKEILFYIWQLPQNLLGLILLLIYQKEKVYHKLNCRTFYYTTEMPSGISLGNYIIMNREDKEDGMKHEYGHTIQSRYLGWFYLIVIGLPSLLGNIYDRLFHTKSRGWTDKESYTWYYNQPWEKWADKLGKVDRQHYIDKYFNL